MCFCQIKNNEEYLVLMGILRFIANNVDDHTETIVKKLQITYLVILAYFVFKRSWC